MIILSRFILMVVLAFGILTTPAFADVFVWKDADSGLSLSFPDRWAKVSNRNVADVLTVQAPGANDYASCRVQIRDDKRFAVYPRRYDAAVQKLNFSAGFWDEYLGLYEGARIHEVRDGQGLGHGIGSRVDMTFITPGQPHILKQGFALAALNGDQVFVFECSAEFDAYHKWYPVFQSVLKSVQKDQFRAFDPHGFYRSFLKDPVLRIHNRDAANLYSF